MQSIYPAPAVFHGQSRWLPICWSVKDAKKIPSQKSTPLHPTGHEMLESTILHPALLSSTILPSASSSRVQASKGEIVDP